jgi:hypothetical protein
VCGRKPSYISGLYGKAGGDCEATAFCGRSEQSRTLQQQVYFILAPRAFFLPSHQAYRGFLRGRTGSLCLSLQQLSGAGSLPVVEYHNYQHCSLRQRLAFDTRDPYNATSWLALITRHSRNAQAMPACRTSRAPSPSSTPSRLRASNLLHLRRSMR